MLRALVITLITLAAFALFIGPMFLAAVAGFTGVAL